MASVQIDIVEGAGLTETRDGYECTRTAIVSGLTGSSHQRLYNALATSGVPARGDPHPSIPGLRVDTRSAAPEPGSPGIVRVTLTYRALTADDLAGGQTDIEVGSTVVSEQTSRDIDGNLMLIVHEIEELDSNGNVVNVREEEQVGTVSVQRPMATYVVRRKENLNPEPTARQYVGRVGSFLGRGSNWLCTSIRGTSSDGGLTYDVTYEFQHRPGGWLATVDPIDPTTGQPYPNGTPRYYSVYPSAAFSDLDLPDPAGDE